MRLYFRWHRVGIHTGDHALTNLVIILAVLFGALFLFIHLTERVAKPLDAKQAARLSRWILPLVGMALVIQLFRHYF